MSNSKIHRFYLGRLDKQAIQKFGEQRMWLQDKALMHQWQNVLRLRVGENVGLFDNEVEFIYSIAEFKQGEIVLEKVTEETRKLPNKQLLLAWSMIKKDNNDLVLQKSTELGVTHFVPLLAERSEKTGFDEVRALRIVIEAAEQCGRSDIPIIGDLLSPEECIERFSKHYTLYVADKESPNTTPDKEGSSGVLIGPEGGWSEKELAYFKQENIAGLNLGDLTLRAETAAIVAVHALQ